MNALTTFRRWLAGLALARARKRLAAFDAGYADNYGLRPEIDNERAKIELRIAELEARIAALPSPCGCAMGADAYCRGRKEKP